MSADQSKNRFRFLTNVSRRRLNLLPEFKQLFIMIECLVSFLAVLALTCYVGAVGSPDIKDANQPDQNPAGQDLSSSELFNFEQYRRLYNKSYSSNSELAARQKIYLARAMRVVISRLLYKLKLKDYYLSINKRSD